MKNIILSIFFCLIVSCGGGGYSNSYSQTEPLTLKDVPERISIFD
tara:strand:- start:755 stop:889 length:135 start_codon:yes stop_codon:yes gene_type:complete